MIYLVDNEGKEGKKFKNASVEDVYKYFKGVKEIQVDTETQGFDPYTKKVLSLQLGDYNNQFVIDTSKIDIREFKLLLENKEVTYLFQNAKFDLRFMYHHGINIPKVYDTFLAEKILSNGDQQRRRALDKLVIRYCDVDIIDKDIRGQIQWRGLDDTVIEYAANDVK